LHLCILGHHGAIDISFIVIIIIIIIIIIKFELGIIALAGPQRSVEER